MYHRPRQHAMLVPGLSQRVIPLPSALLPDRKKYRSASPKEWEYSGARQGVWAVSAFCIRPLSFRASRLLNGTRMELLPFASLASGSRNCQQVLGIQKQLEPRHLGIK
jgi:hypothetical protein